MSPCSSPEGTAGLMRILLLVLASQITVLLGINFLASLDCVMTDNVKLIKVCQWPSCVSFFSQQCMYESLGSGTSDNKVNKESDQANREANRSIMFFKDSDTSLWQSQANYFFK